MKSEKLRSLIFFALCCDLGLFSKRLISPAANVITELLHIPGGIATSFSLLFIVVAAALLPRFGCAALMGAVQSIIALAMGMNGSMGALSPIGYIMPGLAIDCVFFLGRKWHIDEGLTATLANMMAGAAACLTANLIVFRLSGLPLLVYLCVATTTGAICGVLAGELIHRLRPVIWRQGNRKGREYADEIRKSKMDHSDGVGAADSGADSIVPEYS